MLQIDEQQTLSLWETIAPADEQEVLAQLRCSELSRKYDFDSIIGCGGWSLVARATHRQLKIPVAVKLLHPRLTLEEDKVRRFHQEATIASKFEHPNLARVLDFGLLQSGQPYLVMDFLTGVDLESLLNDRTLLPWEEALPIFKQICAGLAAAHGQGVLHRDLKPSNIMLVANGAAAGAGVPLVKIIDFGLARSLRSDEFEIDRLTRTGEALGTPQFMSPEQCMGRRLDARSDIYSFGCIMFECLTGRQVYEAETYFDMMNAHAYQPVPSFDVAPEAVRIPSKLESIVMQTLAKDRDKRPASAEVLREQLESASSPGGNSPVIERTLRYCGWWQRKHQRRNERIGALMLKMISVLVVLGTICAYAVPALENHQWKEKTDSAQAALKRGDYTTAERNLIEAVAIAERLPKNSQLLISNLTDLTEVYERTARWDLVDRERAHIAQIKRNAESGQTDDSNSNSNSHLAQQAHAQLLAAPQSVDKSQPQKFYLDWADSLYGTAFLCLKESQPAEAEKLLLKAIELQLAVCPEGYAGLARNYGNLGVSLAMQDKLTDAEHYFNRSLETARLHPGDDEVLLVASLCHLGRLKSVQKQPTESEDYFKQAVAIGESHPPNNAYAVCLEDYAALCRTLHRDAEASELQKSAATVRGQLPQ